MGQPPNHLLNPCHIYGTVWCLCYCSIHHHVKLTVVQDLSPRRWLLFSCYVISMDCSTSGFLVLHNLPEFAPSRTYCLFPQGSPRAPLGRMPNTNRTFRKEIHSWHRPQFCVESASIFLGGKFLLASQLAISGRPPLSPGLQLALPWTQIPGGNVSSQ